MANFGDKLKKAASDAVKSVKDQIDAARKNIKDTTKDAIKSTQDVSVSIKDSIRNNTLRQEIRNSIQKASRPITDKINSFKPDFSKYGFNALLPYKSSMVKLLQSKGIDVNPTDNISKVAVLFHDSVVKGKSNFEYNSKRYNHAEGEGKGEGIDWATVVKICTTILTWLKTIWDQQKKDKEAKAEAAALAQASGSLPAPTPTQTPEQVFANETLNTTLYGKDYGMPEQTEAGSSKIFKVILALIAIGLLIKMATK